VENFLSFLFAAALIGFFLVMHLRKLKKRDHLARQAMEKGQLRSDGPRSQHPHIDANHCIGCSACTSVCPEGDVLAMLGGKAVIANKYKCIGHSLCAEACPVGAITMVMSSPSVGENLAVLTPEYETTLKNLFIAGELGGSALIKNAINQGRACIDVIAKRMPSSTNESRAPEIYDVLIVGAGPAGISASLRAIEKKLNYITLDEAELGGTVAKYPRQKLVMTSPVEMPLYGKFKKTELSKEELLEFWNKVLRRSDFQFRSREKVENIQKDATGIFNVLTANSRFCARAVILALGRAGSPRKLGVKGEELPKVMYRLIEADHYVHKNILVVGGGDSAVEAAMGLASQVGNTVTLSYRQAAFGRIKERNQQRIAEFMRKGKLKVVFNSNPHEIAANAVVLEVGGALQRIANDFVFVFAGGEPPTAFLKKIGVGFGSRDHTPEAGKETHEPASVLAHV
jgi:putative YpdA family bacillithiol system oxidoreductase